MSWLMILLVLVVPSYYEALAVFRRDHPPVSRAGSASGMPRPLLQSYRRLAPFAELIGRSDAVLLVSRYSVELAHYIGRGRPRILDYNQIVLDSAAEIEVFLADRGAIGFYVAESLPSRRLRTSP